LVISTVKPSAVAVGVSNVGVNAASSDVAVTSAEPPAYPVRVVVIVAVELVPVATPVTVTKPVPLIATVPRSVLLTATVPDGVAVPAHV
jgi:hypothetical protein